MLAGPTPSTGGNADKSRFMRRVFIENHIIIHLLMCFSRFYSCEVSLQNSLLQVEVSSFSPPIDPNPSKCPLLFVSLPSNPEEISNSKNPPPSSLSSRSKKLYIWKRRDKIKMVMGEYVKLESIPDLLG